MFIRFQPSDWQAEKPGACFRLRNMMQEDEHLEGRVSYVGLETSITP
jgi:hypothetical protein